MTSINTILMWLGEVIEVIEVTNGTELTSINDIEKNQCLIHDEDEFEVISGLIFPT